MAEGRQQSDCPSPPAAVPVAEDAVMLIARQVAQELGAALAGELRPHAAASHGMPELLTVEDVGRLLRVGPKTVRRWRLERFLPPPIDLRGVIRWRREAIEAWLEEREGAR